MHTITTRFYTNAIWYLHRYSCIIKIPVNCLSDWIVPVTLFLIGTRIRNIPLAQPVAVCPHKGIQGNGNFSEYPPAIFIATEQVHVWSAIWHTSLYGVSPSFITVLTTGAFRLPAERVITFPFEKLGKEVNARLSAGACTMTHTIKCLVNPWRAGCATLSRRIMSFGSGVAWLAHETLQRWWNKKP